MASDHTDSNTTRPFQMFDPEPCGDNAATDDMTLFRLGLTDSDPGTAYTHHDLVLDQCPFAGIDLQFPALYVEGSSGSHGEVSRGTKH